MADRNGTLPRKKSANALSNGETKIAKTEGKSKEAKSAKSKLIAYILWLFGGVFGAHHFYLRRDDHGFLTWCSLGGYFGIGWLRDLFKIPTYVADANDQPEYMRWLKNQMRANEKPTFSTPRFIGAVVISYLWGQLVYMAIPEDEINGMNLKPLMILIPAAVALGVWVVGNVGREEGSIWVPLGLAYACYPTLTYIGDDSTWMSLMVLAAALGFDTWSKKWRLREKPKRSAPRRILVVFTAGLIYSSLWGSYFYFNARLTDSEGEEIRLSDAVKHFLTSPIWLDLKASLQETWRHAQHNGFWATWRQLVDLTDPRGEINAYRVLGLSQTASQSEVTSRWRSLSRENHPDKVKGTEEERRAAQEKFMEIQQAYEILSSAKNRRQNKNRKTA